MSGYWIGICAGLVIGAMFGFFLCALMVTAKKADRQMEAKFEMCEMCSMLLTLLDRIEIITNNPKIIEITKQRMKIAEQMGLTVSYGGEQSGEMQ